MAVIFDYLLSKKKAHQIGNVKTLYHQTSRENAKKILNKNTMYPGNFGLAGGGIYFATTIEDTNHKAHSKGVVLECQVALGNCKTLGMLGEHQLNVKQLYQDGYHSVLIPRSGDEYVVYSPSQVLKITKIKEYELKDNYQSVTHKFNNKFEVYQPSGTLNW